MAHRYMLLIAATALPMLATLPAMATRMDKAVSAADRSFVAMVSQGGQFEVKAGELAADMGSTQDIKDQGTTESHDHKLVGDKLKSAASSADINIDSDLNADFQKKLDDLKKLSGLAFDKAYLAEMEKIHAKDGAAFAKEAQSGSNPALRDFAKETHRIVVRHIGELHASGAGQP
jgi:putative membrane protein